MAVAVAENSYSSCWFAARSRTGFEAGMAFPGGRLMVEAAAGSDVVMGHHPANYPQGRTLGAEEMLRTVSKCVFDVSSRMCL